MKFLIALAFLAVAAGDVSHLFNAYLPPVNTANSASTLSHGGSTDIRITNSAAYNEIDSTVPAIRYGAPVVQQSFSGSDLPATFSAPLVHTSFAAAPSFRYSAPAFQSTHSIPSVQTTYSSGPVISYSMPSVRESYSAPAFQSTFSGPVVESYAAPHIQMTHHAAPSVSYSTSDVQSSLSAPDAHESISGSDVGTQYAADGGYVY